MPHDWQEYPFLNACWECKNCGKLGTEIDPPVEEQCEGQLEEWSDYAIAEEDQ